MSTSALGPLFDPEGLSWDIFAQILDSAKPTHRLSNWFSIRTVSTKLWKFTQNENVSHWLWEHLHSHRNRIYAYLLCDPLKIFQREVSQKNIAYKLFPEHEIYYQLRGEHSSLRIYSSGNVITICNKFFSVRNYVLCSNYANITICSTNVKIQNFLLNAKKKILIIGLNDGRIKIIDFNFLVYRIMTLKNQKMHIKHLAIDSKRLYTISDPITDNEDPSKRIISVWDLKKNSQLAKFEQSIWDIPKIEVDKVGIIFDTIYTRAVIYKTSEEK